MAPKTHADVKDSVAGCAVTHRTEAVEFADLLVADDEWVRREFDAIVAAGWGGVVPPRPAPIQGAHRPQSPRYGDSPTPVQPLRGLLTGSSLPARQRGPPDW
jgi:hypothetical protein